MIRSYRLREGYGYHMERLWMDNTKAPKERAALLLKEMTLKEKVGQLNQRLFGFQIFQKVNGEVVIDEQFYREVEKYSGLGVLYGLFRADPWSGKDYESGLTGELAVKTYNRLQKYVIEHSRLQIPMLTSSECPHGHQALDGYLLPVNLAAGATFHPELLKAGYEVCGKQLKEMGVNFALCSMLDMVRDPRWGRSEECYGEDPYLSAQMAQAAVSGLNEQDLLVVAKHFAAQGDGTGGVNAAAAKIGERELREIHFPALEGAIRAGAKGIMAAYNEIDGIYCHANRKLLTEMVKEELGFDGIIMADGVAIDQLDKMTGDNTRSAALALHAGVDIGLWDEGFGKLEEAVDRKLINIEEIDQAVLKVLTLKFEQGLFENPYAEEKQSTFSYKEHEQSLKLARESVILLQNNNTILPLENVDKLCVIGPDADDIYAQLGDYTPPVRKECAKTVLAGIKEVFRDKSIQYALGSELRTTDEALLLTAEQAAKESDVTILVLGTSSSRFKEAEFDINGAARITDSLSMDCGEGMDCADIDLPEAQLTLLQRVRAHSKKLITIVIAGRPVVLAPVCKASDAVLLSFYPGPMGGQAIAEILKGVVNPSGRLPVSIPANAGQIPVYYNHKISYPAGKYLDVNAEDGFSFGFGLDYAAFGYQNFSLSQAQITEAELQKQNISVRFVVKNESDRAGACVPQIYIRDQFASIVPRIRELKGFKKLFLEPGQEQQVTIELGWDAFSMIGLSMKREVETGVFLIEVKDKDELLWSTALEVN